MRGIVAFQRLQGRMVSRCEIGPFAPKETPQLRDLEELQIPFLCLRHSTRPNLIANRIITPRGPKMPLGFLNLSLIQQLDLTLPHLPTLFIHVG